MREFDCDLQLHGVYAGGVSRNMLLPVISEQAKLKGLGVLVTADILHGKWFEHVKENISEESNGEFWDREKRVAFIIGTEVEDVNRAHHLIYLPDLERVLELREKLLAHGNLDCQMCGRPKLRLNAEAIAEKVEEAKGIIGPAHSFTPYTGLYAHFDSVKKAYGGMGEKISFIELGLSADTDLADLIEENQGYHFLSSSDAHSPWPNRLGREFNRIKMKKPAFKELKHALEKREERLVTLNVGLNPKEGKYHLTACNSCYQKYSLENAEKLSWKCIACKGEIKKGVRDRIMQLASFPQPRHPGFRPKYLHFIPLAEIIQIALEVENVNSVRVQELWKQFVENFGNEISVLIDVPAEEIKEFNEKVGKKIEAFKSGWVLYVPGGGGRYGKPVICDSEKEFERKQKEMEKELQSELKMHGQKRLGEF